MITWQKQYEVLARKRDEAIDAIGRASSRTKRAHYEEIAEICAIGMDAIEKALIEARRGSVVRLPQ